MRSGVYVGEGEVAEKLSPLLKMFSHSLSSCSLLVHSAWQAARLWTTDPAKVCVRDSTSLYLYYCIAESFFQTFIYVPPFAAINFIHLSHACKFCVHFGIINLPM